MYRYAVGGGARGPIPWRPPEPRPGHALRVMTMNVAHGRRLATHQALLARRTLLRNLELIGNFLRAQEADVVALQEADGPSAWSGNLDHVARLAGLAGYEGHFRGDHNPFGSTVAPVRSGTAVLAREELSEVDSHAFGTSWRDTKGFVVAKVRAAWDGDVDVVSLHLDFLAPTRRFDQLLLLGEVLAKRPDRPRVLLGDFNCCGQLDPEAHRILVDQLGLHTVEHAGGHPTYPSARPRLRLDWIFASRELEFHAYYTLARPLSDHLSVLADLTLAAS